jgi:ferredoxin-NADP reductase
MTALLSAPAAAGTPADDDELLLQVAAATELVPGVRELVLRRPDGGLLPGYPPGSHLVLRCGARRNAYSLTGNGSAGAEYRISVRLLPEGAGGSAFVHRLQPGDLAGSSRPRSAFAPVSTARHHLLVAAGIGVTPVLSHARAAARWGRSFAVVYGYRPGAAAHLAELRELGGDRLIEARSRVELAAAVTAALSAQPMGTHVYVCGPGPVTTLVEQTAAELGWPAERVHAERFAADLDPGAPFVARLARSGGRVAVEPGVSLLAALEAAGVPAPSSCRQGVCGECRVGVTAGRPQHRDLYLSEAERAAGDAVMTCVSRCLDQELELDL